MGRNRFLELAAETDRRGVLPPPAPRAASPFQGLDRNQGSFRIPLGRIERDPDHPREEFDQESLQGLAQSLKRMWQLQPTRVRLDESTDRFIILGGERRWRAAKLAGLPSLACIVHQSDLSRAGRLAIHLEDNSPREGLRPIEQARAYLGLMEACGLNRKELAELLHVSQPTMSRTLSLLQLPDEVQEMVERGEIKPTSAYEISRAHPDDQEEIARYAISQRMIREEVAQKVRESLQRVRTGTFETDCGLKITISSTRGHDRPTIRRALAAVIEMI